MSLYVCGRCGQGWRSGFFGGLDCPSCPPPEPRIGAKLVVWAVVLGANFALLLTAARLGWGGEPVLPAAPASLAWKYADLFLALPDGVATARLAARAAAAAPAGSQPD
jgi:hypothetical protein